MDDTPKLKPCPFCGGHSVSSDGLVYSNKGVIFCHDCGSFGPHPAYDTFDPVPTWNTRATGWQPIETAPKDGTIVFVYLPESHRHGTFADKINKAWWIGELGEWRIGVGMSHINRPTGCHCLPRRNRV